MLSGVSLTLGRNAGGNGRSPDSQKFPRSQFRRKDYNGKLEDSHRLGQTASLATSAKIYSDRIYCDLLSKPEGVEHPVQEGEGGERRNNKSNNQLPPPRANINTKKGEDVDC